MFSATDIASFLACQHTATLARAESRDEITKPFFADPALDLLRKLGIEHEQRYLRELAEKNGLVVARIDTNARWEDAVADTIRALREGVDVVYQATFLDAPWRGRSDFLVRVNKPSDLGAWSYEVVETKLARSTKATALVQLCFYSDLLARIQGIEPQWMHVVLGGAASPECFQVQHYIAYFRKVRNEFEQSWKLDTNTYPEPTEHCEVCSWFPVCDDRRRADDHLSFVAGITQNQRKALVGRGVTTVVAIAKLVVPPKPKIERIGDAALLRIREQARLQVQGREEGRLVYELIDDVEEGKGLGILPSPSPADLFLDLEANPYVLDQGLEYLIGMVTLPAAASEPMYESLWALTRSDERNAFEAFIGKVVERWHKNPEMHVYHYAPYEPTAIKRLAGKHARCVDEVDELLRAGCSLISTAPSAKESEHPWRAIRSKVSNRSTHSPASSLSVTRTLLSSLSRRRWHWGTTQRNSAIFSKPLRVTTRTTVFRRCACATGLKIGERNWKVGSGIPCLDQPFNLARQARS